MPVPVRSAKGAYSTKTNRRSTGPPDLAFKAARRDRRAGHHVAAHSWRSRQPQLHRGSAARAEFGRGRLPGFLRLLAGGAEARVRHRFQPFSRDGPRAGGADRLVVPGEIVRRRTSDEARAAASRAGQLPCRTAEQFHHDFPLRLSACADLLGNSQPTGHSLPTTDFRPGTSGAPQFPVSIAHRHNPAGNPNNIPVIIAETRPCRCRQADGALLDARWQLRRILCVEKSAWPGREAGKGLATRGGGGTISVMPTP